MTLDDLEASQDGLVFEYDVALSFAGQQRRYVEEVAAALRARGLRVFYDYSLKATLSGKNLYQYLAKVYRSQARLVVLFFSADYAHNRWTRRELESAQARAFEEDDEYILPVRFDDTEIPGVLPTTGFIDLRKVTRNELVEIIETKLEELRKRPAGSRITGGSMALGRRPCLRRSFHPKKWALVSVAAAAVGVMASQINTGVSTTNDSVSLALAVLTAVVGGTGLAVAGYAWQRSDPLPPPPFKAAALVLTSLLLGAAGGCGFAALGATGDKPVTFTEVAYNRSGTPLFSDPGFHPVGDGARIPFGTTVEVRCKVMDASGMASVTAWYLIDSEPWRGLYAPSDTFLNGDDGPSGTTWVDPRVPDC
jgi:hypothetical protein